MFRNGKKKFLFAGLAVAMAFTVTGCGSETDGEKSASENGTSTENVGRDRLVVGMTGNALSLDLHGSNDGTSSLVNVQIFETLVTQNEDMEILPGLAESWESVDDRIYEFTLKQGVMFHNGEELTAHDVEFTLRRATESAQVAAIVGEIDPDTLVVVDDYTIQVGTFSPFAPLLSHLAHSSAGIMNQLAVEEAGEQVGRQPVGTGPFEFVNWNADNSIDLRRFEDYHGELPAYSELLMRAITETSQRTVELETGEIDIAISPAASDIRRIEDHADLLVLRGPSLQTNYLGFNIETEPFNNPLVRQAINYAVNVELIRDTILEGMGSIATGPIGSNVWGARTDLQMFDYDVERAKELMAEAGLENGFETHIATNDNPERVQIATVIANQLGEIGIDVEIKQVEWGTYLDALADGEFDMFMMGWTSVTGDADYGLYPLFHSSHHGAAGNRTFYTNARVDELLDLARGTRDEEVRLEAYSEIQELIVEDAPWVFLTNPEATVAMQNDVRGVIVNPTGHHRFANVYFE